MSNVFDECWTIHWRKNISALVGKILSFLFMAFVFFNKKKLILSYFKIVIAKNFLEWTEKWTFTRKELSQTLLNSSWWLFLLIDFNFISALCWLLFSAMNSNMQFINFPLLSLVSFPLKMYFKLVQESSCGLTETKLKWISNQVRKSLKFVTSAKVSMIRQNQIGYFRKGSNYFLLFQVWARAKDFVYPLLTA